MHPFLAFLLRLIITLPTTVAIWLISFFVYSQPYWLASLFALGGGAIVYSVIKWYTSHHYLKRHRLTRKEYAYIVKNLKEAQKKIQRLQKVFFSMRNIGAFKQMLEIIRLTKRIQTIIKKEPGRFFKAEKFYFYHLDSIVELSEKYTFLASQPAKNDKLSFSLNETRDTLKDLKRSIEKDLYEVLSSDIDHLEMELDVAKHSLKTLKNPLSKDDERRTIK
ncbi:5-bromo-4-chloroindolyl phosphate hydrolysis family protein [Bacillus sporothermodurans]|uniref:5-bromo-4-chloroindolyl phosphate hydrolysis family protein n=1 Tax=Heyndrickxia sporothermodurans TaxID=46224 RepID=UPI00192C88CC|nr:5-bromo-4-chloroindolyl phosphate hydrolysis family protein [Heyndrickxia sporothermodurans]MBL5779145.1 5-bromo-4-chloroindolyl phosphate hydrolysis family protein [Heyndrickxia sporothermodurans]